MDGPLIAAALAMVLLHRADGGEVSIVVPHVTGLHAPAPPPNTHKLSPATAHCVLWLADGRLLSVIEPCDVVRRLLDEAGR